MRGTRIPSQVKKQKTNTNPAHTGRPSLTQPKRIALWPSPAPNDTLITHTESAGELRTSDYVGQECIKQRRRKKGSSLKIISTFAPLDYDPEASFSQNVRAVKHDPLSSTHTLKPAGIQERIFWSQSEPKRMRERERE